MQEYLVAALGAYVGGLIALLWNMASEEDLRSIDGAIVLLLWPVFFVFTMLGVIASRIRTLR